MIRGADRSIPLQGITRTDRPVRQDGIGGDDDTRHLRNVWAGYTRDAPQEGCGSLRKNCS